MRKQGFKTVSPEISETSTEFFLEHFQSVNAGATYILDSHRGLFQRTLQEVKGVFSKNELMLIIDVFNGTMLTAGIAGQHLNISVQDGMELDCLDKKWEIDKDALLTKVAELTIYQRSVLEIWANGYWYGKRPEDKNRDYNKYAKALI